MYAFPWGEIVTLLCVAVVRPDPQQYMGNWTDNTGYAFVEAYVTDASGCTNWESHDNMCLIGCKGGTSCSGHTCSCTCCRADARTQFELRVTLTCAVASPLPPAGGASTGLFGGLSTAVANGTCGDHNIGSQWVMTMTSTDDDASRPAVIQWCFIGNAPQYRHKTYIGAGVTVAAARAEGEMIPQVKAPEHVTISEVYTTFYSITAGSQPSSMFYPAASCKC
jgi:hypothetical protein